MSLTWLTQVREGAIDDEPRIYYRIRAINRAQAISSVYLGPITVDAAPPVPFAPASSITFASNSTHFVANWPAALFQTSPSGLCRIDVCFGVCSFHIRMPDLFLLALLSLTID